MRLQWRSNPAQVLSELFQGRMCDFLGVKAENDEPIMLINLTTSFEKANGLGIGDLVNEVVFSIKRIFDEHFAGSTQAMVNEILDYEQVKDKLWIRLISSECYQKYYGNAVVRQFHDMYQMISINYGDYSIVVFNEHLEEYGIKEDEIFADALDSMMKSEGIELTSLANIIMPGDESIVEFDEFDDEMAPMWCLSNQLKNYGASVILYPGALEKIAETWDDSFYVIPSSVHEFLLIPTREFEIMGMDKNHMRGLIKEINRTMVDEKDRLSDNLYYYDHETKTLTQCFGERKEELKLKAV